MNALLTKDEESGSHHLTASVTNVCGPKVIIRRCVLTLHVSPKKIILRQITKNKIRGIMEIIVRLRR